MIPPYLFIPPTPRRRQRLAEGYDAWLQIRHSSWLVPFLYFKSLWDSTAWLPVANCELWVSTKLGKPLECPMWSSGQDSWL
ncbi:hypothetical protein CEXT_407561 [Caerostris extrusa]|uniref:Uncharacterized protein n=1 Tax=Caerostris extrusa TaxID=172846 RepID=A0AAV4QT59_CAEEX|nr:hypothetical protein CEXT_407561 [Caerostris extrusa]